MAGVEGFEPPNAGTRNQCLTTWRHPIMLSVLSVSSNNLAVVDEYRVTGAIVANEGWFANIRFAAGYSAGLFWRYSLVFFSSACLLSSDWSISDDWFLERESDQKVRPTKANITTIITPPTIILSLCSCISLVYRIIMLMICSPRCQEGFL